MSKTLAWSRVLHGLAAAIGLAVLRSATVDAAALGDIARGLVLKGVTIVDTHDGKLTADVALRNDGGKITEIVPSGAVAAAGEAKTIDLGGRFIVPGYLDMHAHALGSSDREVMLSLMLANGITGFRQMSGSPKLLQARREGELMPPVGAPELLAMPGMVLTALTAGSPLTAVGAVQRQKAQGADFIKVIDTNPAAFFAALKEANRLGLPLVGHLPAAVNVVDASRAGMKSIEHLGPTINILVACSTEKDALQRATRETAAPKLSLDFRAGWEKMMEKATANPLLLLPSSQFPRIQRLIDTFSDAKCRELAAEFVARGTWQTPTLIRERTMQLGDDAQYRSDPNLRYVPEATRQLWEELAQQFSKTISPASKATLVQLYALQQKLVKIFSEAGVKMLAGDDLGGQWIVPGFGLHQELDELAKADLSPLVVLQMATLNGAQFLGRESCIGRVVAGADANLVLLDGNPIESVQNLHKIHAVVRGGVYYSRDALDALKKNAQDRQARTAGRPQY